MKDGARLRSRSKLVPNLRHEPHVLAWRSSLCHSANRSSYSPVIVSMPLQIFDESIQIHRFGGMARNLFRVRWRFERIGFPTWNERYCRVFAVPRLERLSALDEQRLSRLRRDPLPREVSLGRPDWFAHGFRAPQTENVQSAVFPLRQRVRSRLGSVPVKKVGIHVVSRAAAARDLRKAVRP